MPAKTALSVDHAEFGEVSIRIEQSASGRLSAELSAADPELQRAVSAAVAADRGHSAGAEGDGGRSMHQANARGLAAGGEGSTGERGPSGNARESDHQRTPRGRPAEPASADPHGGVFA